MTIKLLEPRRLDTTTDEESVSSGADSTRGGRLFADWRVAPDDLARHLLQFGMSRVATEYCNVVDWTPAGSWITPSGYINRVAVTSGRTLTTGIEASTVTYQGTDWQCNPTRYVVFTMDSGESPLSHASQSTRGPLGYTWQERLRQLRGWRGEPEEGEAESLSEEALTVAEQLATYADQRFASHYVHLPSILAPLSDGGVLVQWTLRGTSVLHLEVHVSNGHAGQLGLLRTRESVAGDVLSAYEVSQATVPDVLFELEKLAINAHRWRRRSATYADQK